jgi:pectate lyase
MNKLEPRLVQTLLMALTLLVMSVSAAAAKVDRSLPAFPGAEGFGAGSIGGRGGRVIKVTNLNTSGPGSLQAAVGATGPRIVVFEVSGVIPGPVVINDGRLTIAGQTAPGAGITIAGRLSTLQRGDLRHSDIIVRFIRVRPSARFGRFSNDDAIQMPNVDHLIFDHISASWGKDETVDLYRSRYVTFQWSMIEESYWHPGFTHNCGLIVGENGNHVSIHHTLFAHHRSRNPCIKAGIADIRNNVIYNFRDGFTQYDHPNFSGQFNLVGNYFKRGPSDPNIHPFNWLSSGKYYVTDTYIEGIGLIRDPWREAHKLHGLRYHAGRGQRAAEPFDMPPVTTHSAQEAYELVLAQAGAWPRDVVSRRTVDEVRRGGGSWGIQEPNDLLEGLSILPAPPDADDDGMPDAWEIMNGLDPHKPDHNSVMSSGYTAIEQYINERADQLIASRGRPVPIILAAGDGRPQAPPSEADDEPAAIEVLDLSFQGTDTDLARLPDESAVTHLYLNASKVTDEGLTQFVHLTQLRVLNLQGTAVTDQGLRHLLAVPTLRAIDLRGTAVTDAGLVQLAELKLLRLLIVPEAVTDQAISTLRHQRPDLTISRQ